MQKEIDNLIAKKLSGNASAQELRELENWVAMDSANARHLAEAERLWGLAGSLKGVPDEADADAAWSEFRQLADTAKVRRLHVPAVYLKAAAAIFLVVSTVFLVRMFIFPASDEQAVAMVYDVAGRTDTFTQVLPPVVKADTQPDLEAPAAVTQPKARKSRKQKQVAMVAVSSADSGMVFTLPDNTVVYLNRNSKLIYPEKFTGGERSVYLSGEAYFELASASGNFMVYCHDTRTRVMGTAVNVKGLRDGMVEISAIAGDVEVSRRGDDSYQPLLVKAGVQVVYDKNSHAITKAKINKKDRWWKRGGFRMIKDFFSRIIHPRNQEKQK